MSRCSACNEILSPGELLIDNPKTNEPETHCRACRNPHHDTGVDFNFKTGKVENFRNEADQISMNPQMGDLGDLEDVVSHIRDTGNIRTVEV